MTMMTHKKTGIRVDYNQKGSEYIAELYPPQHLVLDGTVEDTPTITFRTDSEAETKAAVKIYLDWGFNSEFLNKFTEDFEKALDGEKPFIEIARKTATQAIEMLQSADELHEGSDLLFQHIRLSLVVATCNLLDMKSGPEKKRAEATLDLIEGAMESLASLARVTDEDDDGEEYDDEEEEEEES